MQNAGLKSKLKPHKPLLNVLHVYEILDAERIRLTWLTGRMCKNLTQSVQIKVQNRGQKRSPWLDWLHSHFRKQMND